MGHYQDLYQGRKASHQAPAAAQQPINQSMVEHFAALDRLPMDASGGGYTPEERQSAREIKQLMAEGRFGIGQIIPHRLLPLIYDYAVPEHMKELQASTSVTARLAQKIDASLATDVPVTRRGLAVDTQPGRGRGDIAPDHAQLRGNMSYRLRQVMGDHAGSLPEDLFDAEMLRAGVRDIAERIALKTEAVGLGLIRPRGSQQATTYMPGMMDDDDAVTYMPGMLETMTYMPGSLTSEITDDPDDPEHVCIKLTGKVDRKTAEGWKKLLEKKPTKPAHGPSGEGLTLKAAADDGTAAYHKTSIWVKDSHLDTL